jgi:hypothetical protein
MPVFVVPPVATTAKTLSGSVDPNVPERRSAVIRPEPSWGTGSTSTSITRAAPLIEEWASLEHTTVQRSGRWPRRSAAVWRAATSPDRFPAEPPETKTPPAPTGMPARSAIQRSAWFSAQMAPAPSSHPAPMIDEAPTTRSKSTDAFEGAPGTKARLAGWSVESVAGASRSDHTRSASNPPRPPGVIVAPARRSSSSLEGVVPSSGCGCAMRFSAYRTMADASVSVSSSQRCISMALAPLHMQEAGSEEPASARFALRVTSTVPGRTPRTRRCRAARRPRCAGPRPSTAPRRRES